MVFLAHVCILTNCGPNNQSEQHPAQVKVTGVMRKVMLNGDLTSTIDLDTIANKQHLFGIGPMENLRGEILVNDGTAYGSTIGPDSSIQMVKTFNLKAPFFVYANINEWKEYPLPDSVLTVPQLDLFLDRFTTNKSRPFAFKIEGPIRSAKIHVVNLPLGFNINSPGDAQIGQVDYRVSDGEQVEMIGFFSTDHRGIFTHHDTNVHIHLITNNEKIMGHLDELQMGKGQVKLYLPE